MSWARSYWPPESSRRIREAPATSASSASASSQRSNWSARRCWASALATCASRSCSATCSARRAACSRRSTTRSSGGRGPLHGERRRLPVGAGSAPAGRVRAPAARRRARRGAATSRRRSRPARPRQRRGRRLAAASRSARCSVGPAPQGLPGADEVVAVRRGRAEGGERRRGPGRIAATPRAAGPRACLAVGCGRARGLARRPDRLGRPRHGLLGRRDRGQAGLAPRPAPAPSASASQCRPAGLAVSCVLGGPPPGRARARAAAPSWRSTACVGAASGLLRCRPASSARPPARVGQAARGHRGDRAARTPGTAPRRPGAPAAPRPGRRSARPRLRAGPRLTASAAFSASLPGGARTA